MKELNKLDTYFIINCDKETLDWLIKIESFEAKHVSHLYLQSPGDKKTKLLTFLIKEGKLTKHFQNMGRHELEETLSIIDIFDIEILDGRYLRRQRKINQINERIERIDKTDS